MSRDPMTRSTRLAANAAAIALVVYAILWFATTQVRSIREVSPFAEDPWDVVASYAAIFLPLVVGATSVRSLRHREAILPPKTAARIRWGAGFTVGIILASLVADLIALVTVAVPGLAADDRIPLIALLLTVSTLAALAATVLLVRAALIAHDEVTTRMDAAIASPEPDIVDDLLALAERVARPIRLGRQVVRLSAAIERFLDGSALSPRRHRFLFGVVLAIVAAAAFDAWHAVVEGAWASPVVSLVAGTLMAVGVLGIYLGTVGPLRLLRSA